MMLEIQGVIAELAISKTASIIIHEKHFPYVQEIQTASYEQSAEVY